MSKWIWKTVESSLTRELQAKHLSIDEVNGTQKTFTSPPLIGLVMMSFTYRSSQLGD